MNEDAKIFSDCVGQRECQIFKLRHLLVSIQSSITHHLDSMLVQIKDTVLSIKSAESVYQDLENRIINKLYLVRTSSEFQKQVVFQVLEFVLNEFKRITQQYDEKQMQNEAQTLREEVEKLKKDLRVGIQLGRTSVAEILQQIVYFSRGRMTQVLNQAESNIRAWREYFRSRDQLEPPTMQLKAKKRSLDVHQTPKIKYHNQRLVYINPNYGFKKKSTEISSLDSVTNSQRHRVLRDHLSTESVNGQSLIIDTIQAPSRHAHKFRTIDVMENDSSYIIPRPANQKAKSTSLQNYNEFKRYVNFISPTNSLHQECTKSTLLDNYYVDQWNELKNMNENEMRITLYRMYKDLSKANFQIAQEIEAYRRRCVAREGRSSRFNKPTLLQNLQLQTPFNIKEIGRILAFKDCYLEEKKKE